MKYLPILFLVLGACSSPAPIPAPTPNPCVCDPCTGCPPCASKEQSQAYEAGTQREASLKAKVLK